jgi:hypothetical protein
MSGKFIDFVVLSVSDGIGNPSSMRIAFLLATTAIVFDVLFRGINSDHVTVLGLLFGGKVVQKFEERKIITEGRVCE